MVSKLLGYYFKRDKWILLTMAAVPILLMLLYFFFSEEAALGMNMAISYITGIICVIWLYVRDYKRFYGAYSNFFSGLPLTGKEIIGARMIWFILLSLYSVVIFSLKMYEMIIRAGDPGDISALMMEIQETMMQIQPRVIVLMVVGIILSLLFTALIWLFATSVGSEKKFRRFGIGGPIMLYIGVQILYGVARSVIGNTVSNMFDTHAMDNMVDMQYLVGDISNSLFMALVVATVLTTIVCIIMYIRSVYSHDHKLSTYS